MTILYQINLFIVGWPSSPDRWGKSGRPRPPWRQLAELFHLRGKTSWVTLPPLYQLHISICPHRRACARFLVLENIL